MKTRKKGLSVSRLAKELPKCLTGIKGVDEITGGGLPKGHPTLISGTAGCGKTLFAAEFLLHGAMDYNEPGLFVSFEESEEDIARNVASLGIDLKKLVKEKKLTVTRIHIDSSEFTEIGTYNLDGLFIQLDYLVKSLKIKRIVFDTLEVLSSNLNDQAILRAELQRLFRWLKEKKLTAILTAESGMNLLSRHGLEEYVADCVILLDNRIEQQVSTRRMRIIKYRGSSHGANEYPFLISDKGILVLPITSLNLQYIASTKRISTGVERLDTMLDGKGFFKGSSILISGVAGAGKSSLAATFANSVCQNGERCLYFAFEESVSQILRNMKSIGLDLERWVNKGLLKFHAAQPYSNGLESHLVTMHNLVQEFKPAAVIIDPITNLKEIGNAKEVKALFARLIDYLKMHQITILSTSLLSVAVYQQHIDSVSSLMDTWILLQNLEENGEMNRGLLILKSRGMKHSNQMRELIVSNKGVTLEDVYLGSGKVLSGSARLAQEAQDHMNQILRQNELTRKKQRVLNERKKIESQIISLESELKNTTEDINLAISQAKHFSELTSQARDDSSANRMADKSIKKPKKHKQEGGL